MSINSAYRDFWQRQRRWKAASRRGLAIPQHESRDLHEELTDLSRMTWAFVNDVLAGGDVFSQHEVQALVWQARSLEEVASLSTTFAAFREEVNEVIWLLETGRELKQTHE